jgi:hypothetical protein
MRRAEARLICREFVSAYPSARYQLPLAKQEPEPSVVQERVTAPFVPFVIVKLLCDFERPTIV